MRWEDFFLGFMAGATFNWIVYEVLKKLRGGDE